MLKNKAQSLTEYTVCLVAILIALITINLYVKRGLQGRYKDVVDKTTVAALASGQYEPYYDDSSYTNTMGRKIIGSTIKVGGSPPRGNFKRDLPPMDTGEDGKDKPANYMSSGGEASKETKESIKNALQKN